MGWSKTWKRPRDYEVGYQRPPRSSQFQPGQSGNPDGRKKKKVKSIGENVVEIFEEPVSILLDNKPVRMSKLEAILHSTFQKAARGDARALQTLLSLAQQSERSAPRFNYKSITVKLVSPDGETKILNKPNSDDTDKG